jgi:hypothetical protein
MRILKTGWPKPQWPAIGLQRSANLKRGRLAISGSDDLHADGKPTLRRSHRQRQRGQIEVIDETREQTGETNSSISVASGAGYGVVGVRIATNVPLCLTFCRVPLNSSENAEVITLYGRRGVETIRLWLCLETGFSERSRQNRLFAAMRRPILFPINQRGAFVDCLHLMDSARVSNSLGHANRTASIFVKRLCELWLVTRTDSILPCWVPGPPSIRVKANSGSTGHD